MNKQLLYKEVESLCDEVTNIDYNYQLQFNKGLELVFKYKQEGGTQSEAYDTIYLLLQMYTSHEEDEQKMNLVSDLLDCIVGFIGSKKYRIWG